jgi:hypothetical protein
MTENDLDVDRDADAFRVWCEDCDLEEIFRDDDPPRRDVAYHGSVEKARQSWDAYSGALGKYKSHSMAFRDYHQNLRHRAHLEALDEQ